MGLIQGSLSLIHRDLRTLKCYGGTNTKMCKTKIVLFPPQNRVKHWLASNFSGRPSRELGDKSGAQRFQPPTVFWSWRLFSDFREIYFYVPAQSPMCTQTNITRTKYTKYTVAHFNWMGLFKSSFKLKKWSKNIMHGTSNGDGASPMALPFEITDTRFWTKSVHQ